MNISLVKLLGLAVSIGMLAACAINTPQPVTPSMLLAARMQPRELKAQGFVLQSYLRLERSDRPIRVYIEGDGHAWMTRWEPAPDPTPRYAVGLRLAVLDSSPNVVYLARPCQYTRVKSPACEEAYWTDKRYSSEVVTAMSQALDQVLQTVASPQVELVGYSGGAAIAVMLAAQRHDVVSLRTVAGNLDSEAVNQYHHVSAMPLSQNPITYASALAHLPQRHFTGGRDRVIPPFISAGFIAHTACSAHNSIFNVADADHQSGWETVWPELLTLVPECTSPLDPVSRAN